MWQSQATLCQPCSRETIKNSELVWSPLKNLCFVKTDLGILQKAHTLPNSHGRINITDHSPGQRDGLNTLWLGMSKWHFQGKMAFPPFPSIQIFNWREKNRVKMGAERLAPHASETKLQQLMGWISCVLPTAVQGLIPEPVWWRGSVCLQAWQSQGGLCPPSEGSAHLPAPPEPCTPKCQMRQRSRAHRAPWEGTEATFSLGRTSGHRNPGQTLSPISLDLNHFARLHLSSSVRQVTNRATRGCYNIYGPQIPSPGT